MSTGMFFHLPFYNVIRTHRTIKQAYHRIDLNASWDMLYRMWFSKKKYHRTLIRILEMWSKFYDCINIKCLFPHATTLIIITNNSNDTIESLTWATEARTARNQIDCHRYIISEVVQCFLLLSRFRCCCCCYCSNVCVCTCACACVQVSR